MAASGRQKFPPPPTNGMKIGMATENAGGYSGNCPIKGKAKYSGKLSYPKQKADGQGHQNGGNTTAVAFEGVIIMIDEKKKRHLKCKRIQDKRS